MSLTDICALIRYQVGLYDVRFSAESLLERAAKAIQFLVMIGFAVVGPKYSVGAVAAARSTESGNNDGPTMEWYFVSGKMVVSFRARVC